MSNTAIFNIAEAERFAKVLDKQSKEMAGETASITAKLNALHSNWRDVKFEEFDRLFVEATAHLKRFTGHAENYAQYLRKKAEIAAVFLQRRY